MAKKPKNETISDILDRIEEDINSVREKAEELENHDCCDEDSEDSDDDSDE